MSDSVHRSSTLPGGARRRYLTILFSDLSGSTSLAAAMEAEHYGELLRALREAYHEVIGKHGGTVVRIQGDGVLAIFGHPDASEDDGRRATEAALELHQRVQVLTIDPPLPGGFELSLHSGIHSGLVLVDEGDVVRGRFELLGNAPNIAARLSDAAQAGELLVSEETLGPANHFFVTDERRTLQLKGRTEPIHVHRIVGRAPTRTRFEARAQRGLMPFIGRERELGLLQAGLLNAINNQPGYLAMSAPPGVGKTRLSEEFLQRAVEAGAQVHRGYCESYLSAEPLQPFLQMLRSLAGLSHGMPVGEAVQRVDQALSAIEPALMAWRLELLRGLSLNAAPEGRAADHQNMVSALRDLFAALARRQPLVLFIDDWQWADGASRQTLEAVRGLTQLPILVLIATRGFAVGDAGMSDAQIIDLAPLGDDEATQAIERLLPRSDPFIAAEIRRYSGGNPLFIEELCHFEAQADPDHKSGRPHGSEVWLDALIESRVSRLPPAQAEVVRAAAVIGNVIPAWLLERITGCKADDPLVQGLAELDFIFPGDQPGTLRFKHGLARDVIYGAVGLHQRRQMHLRIASAIAQHTAPGAEDDSCEALAYHFGAGGDAQEAARFAELAGDKARAASALDRAQSQYRAALDALDQLPAEKRSYRRWISISHRLGITNVFDPSRDHLDVFRRAVDAAVQHDDPAAIAQSEYWLGYIHYALGESQLAIHHCERSLQAARQAEDDPLAVQIRATLGQARAAAGDYERSLELLNEAIAVKRLHRSGARPSVGSAYSLACKGAILGDRGLFDDAQACFEEALDVVRSARHEVEGSILCLRSNVYLWQGRWNDALNSGQQAQRIAERVKSLYVFAMGRSLGAYAGWVVDRNPESLQVLRDATSWMQVRDKGLFISLNHGWLTDGLVSAGRAAEARQHAARALTRSRMRDRIGEAMAYRALARAAAQAHAPQTVKHYLDQAMRCARARGSPHEQASTQLCQAEIALALGETAQARGLLDEAASAFTHMKMDWHLEQARCLRASA